MGIIKNYDDVDSNADQDKKVKTTLKKFLIDDGHYTVDSTELLKYMDTAFSSLNIRAAQDEDEQDETQKLNDKD